MSRTWVLWVQISLSLYYLMLVFWLRYFYNWLPSSVNLLINHGMLSITGSSTNHNPSVLSGKTRLSSIWLWIYRSHSTVILFVRFLSPFVQVLRTPSFFEPCKLLFLSSTTSVFCRRFLFPLIFFIPSLPQPKIRFTLSSGNFLKLH